jgi:hypothetical protein
MIVQQIRKKVKSFLSLDIGTDEDLNNKETLENKETFENKETLENKITDMEKKIKALQGIYDGKIKEYENFINIYEDKKKVI